MSRLLRSNLIVAAGTTLSRLTGLLRVVVLTYVLGQTALTDAYSLATRRRTSSTTCCSAACCRPRSCRCSRRSTSDERRARPPTSCSRVSATLMLALTAIAVVAAPLIFRLYAIDVGPAVDADLFRSVGHDADADLPGPDPVLRAGRARQRLPQEPPPVLRRGVEPDPAEPHHHRHAAVAARRRRHDWELDDVLSNDRLRWTLGLGATLGIASMAVVLYRRCSAPGSDSARLWNAATRRCAGCSGCRVGRSVSSPPTRSRSSWSATSPTRARATRRAYFDAFTFFVLPHGLLAVSIATTFQPELARAVARKERPAFVDRRHSASG